ncbi:MAG: hypothetical protein EAY75_14800 [Bacteroidetes bacterium]|nr:MAG: hypothetical protein EAY75_14800 [Bacteroidota bacterium]
MEATFVLDPKELTGDFVTVLQNAFKGNAKIKIVVEAEPDETEFVRKYYGESIREAEEQFKNGEYMTFSSASEIEKWVESQSKFVTL